MEEGRGSSGHRRHHRTRATSCAGGGSDGGGGGEGSGGSLTLGASSAPTTYDPPVPSGATASPYYQAVFDTLLLATPEGKIEP